MNGILIKQCSNPKCKQVKPISEFYKDKTKKDGLQSRCKICLDFQHEKYRQTEAGRKARFVENRRYQQTEKGRLSHCLRSRKYSRKNKLICQAQNAVNYAVKIGRLLRPSSLQCSYCPTQAREYHHHKGYQKKHWFDVITVCTLCHCEIRKRKGGVV